MGKFEIVEVVENPEVKSVEIIGPIGKKGKLVDISDDCYSGKEKMEDRKCGGAHDDLG